MMSKLQDICIYVTEKMSVAELTNRNAYISTENMLPEKGGITLPATIPAEGKITAYRKNDVLVSNIRPYFKKIWFALNDGGCSNDVLVFRAKEGISPDYLHYILADNAFFDYAMKTSKGTKMPRGDKKAIMEYEVTIMDFEDQQKTSSILRLIDQQITVNTAINENLESQAQAIFKSWFGADIENLNPSNCKSLGELVTSVDNRGKTPPLSNEKTEYPIIDVRALSGSGRIINFSNCTKYVEEETYNNWFRNGHPKDYDILISTVGSLAEMKIYLGNIGCIAQNVVGFRSKGLSPIYLYQYLNYIRKELVSYNIGSVQPSIKVTHIIKHPIFIPENDKIEKFDMLIKDYTLKIYNNCCENKRLVELRDTLLPKLMNGEIDISKVKT